MHVHLTGQNVNLSVPTGTHILGRGRDCSLRIDDPRLSRHHARLHHAGTEVYIEDLGSTNGVLINGERISGKHQIKNGQTVICGPCIFTVLLDSTQQASKSEMLPQTDRHIDPSDTESMEPLEIPLTDKPPAPREHKKRVTTSLNDTYISTDINSDVSSDALRPSEDNKPGTGALATKDGKKVPIESEKKDNAHKPRNDYTSTLMPAEFTPKSGNVALQPDFPLGEHAESAPLKKRVMGGVLDVLTMGALIMLLVSPILIGGYTWALKQAGVTIEHGLPRLTSTPSPESQTSEIIVSVFRPGGIERATYLIQSLAKSRDQQPFLTIFVSMTIAVLIIILTVLIYAIGATVVSGAPLWHKKMGLVIVERSTGIHLSWSRSFIRWILLLIFLPFFPLTFATNSRGLHDLLSGCEVRQKIQASA